MSIAKVWSIAKVRRLPQHAIERRVAASTSRSRQRAEVRGRVAETIAAALLILKGYRILARRHRGPFGEIDIIAVRGRRIAFVEVKQRHSKADAEAALTAAQADRLGNAVEHWLWRNPRYREHRAGLDAVVMCASLIPRHIQDALHAW